MSVITESEKKRLQSLKQKKQAFKAKEQVIRQALSNLDTSAKNKKIIFDDDIDVQQSTKLTKKRKNRDLFDSDDDNDNKNEKDLWNEEDFNTKKNKKAVLGNDARFTLDDRFTENDKNEKTEPVKDSDQCDLQKEKEKQLNILENILGAPLATKPKEAKQDVKTAKKGLMIRYDPTESKHCEYELKPGDQKEEVKEKKSKKKKRDKHVLEIEEPAPVEVSKDIYYAVSDTLAESLKQKEEFSLLKVHGREKDDTENGKNYDTYISKDNEAQQFKFKFSANDAFKCDSNEDANNISDADERIIETKNDTNANNIFGYRDTLFFDDKDVRFNEAVKFFNTEATLSNEFQNLRRELKMIVRTKIRKNEKRNQPWGNKRKVKRVIKSSKGK